MLIDSYGRQIRDLRVSLTDRCNFRCFYCLPDGEPPLARKDTILTFEEIVVVCEIFVSLGIEKIRLTGGEPLLRKDVESLVEKIARLKTEGRASRVPSPEPLQITDYELPTENRGISSLKSAIEKLNAKSEIRDPKLKDLALTTNGFSLARRAAALKKAGLDRVTVSLDSLKPENFKKITGVDKLAEVLEAIDAAKSAGLDPVRVNAVVVRGWNDDELVELARFARENAVSMRFIEYMPLDSKREWDKNLIVPGREIYRKINEAFPLALKETSRGSETAWKYAFADGAAGEIGIIAPVTEMFCGACSRVRLTADGQIRTCLFSTKEYNLRDRLRGGASRAEIAEFIREVVYQKEPRHYINDASFAPASRSMSFIGG
ncbi:MAG TPA: GTP 3',8-cyclase MoaA [Pyrinomonadaceae bacterium]|jgi:cyclic pyranopterin phosphate synthase